MYLFIYYIIRCGPTSQAFGENGLMSMATMMSFGNRCNPICNE